MDIEDLRETAALAHLNLGDEELAAAFPAFEQMLGYFAAMQAADRDEALFGAAAEAAPAGLSALARTVSSGHFRHDSQNPHNGSSGNPPEDPGARLLDNSGERDGRFVVVPNVL
ncbi:MAG: aspartyl/glutamyl-tRNA amidotransferase subunit C [Treponema sp.]|jgi:aspartyl-tRNA(Asn)/glutamyl-tRNA(Gln) amidotransferase subunit C|nr:aspartyl/glutamyl-tRNA amidotransferase subunit C [Treponema sp.]